MPRPLLHVSSEVIDHSTGLSFSPHCLTSWLSHMQLLPLSPALLTDFSSASSVPSFPRWWLVAGTAPTATSSPETDFLGHFFDLKLFVGRRVGPAGYLALLPRRQAFPGTFF